MPNIVTLTLPNKRFNVTSNYTILYKYCLTYSKKKLTQDGRLYSNNFQPTHAQYILSDPSSKLYSIRSICPV